MSARLDPSMSPGPACGKCGAEKHHTGTRWRCSECYNAWQAARRGNLLPEQRESERIRANALRVEAHALWTDQKRAEVNSKTQAWREENRDRHRQVTRDWHKANAEHARAAKADAYRANPEQFYARNLKRKARLLDAICQHGPDCVTPELLAVVYADQCLYCDRPAEHADHFIPLAAGGLHCRDNLVPACAPCNLSKHASDPWEWIARLTA